jgi:tripartite-type tricarboxylate transporter receptor subunit TctC
VSFLSILAINKLVFDKQPYDSQNDFVSVSQIALQPTIVISPSALPYRNIKEMVEFAKANPGKIDTVHPEARPEQPGAGQFEKSAGISTNLVPFSGDAGAI